MYFITLCGIVLYYNISYKITLYCKYRLPHFWVIGRINYCKYKKFNITNFNTYLCPTRRTMATIELSASFPVYLSKRSNNNATLEVKLFIKLNSNKKWKIIAIMFIQHNRRISQNVQVFVHFKKVHNISICLKSFFTWNISYKSNKINKKVLLS